jgi:hypothetical protein
MTLSRRRAAANPRPILIASKSPRRADVPVASRRSSVPALPRSARSVPKDSKMNAPAVWTAIGTKSVTPYRAAIPCQYPKTASEHSAMATVANMCRSTSKAAAVRPSVISADPQRTKLSAVFGAIRLPCSFAAKSHWSTPSSQPPRISTSFPTPAAVTTAARANDTCL